MNLLGIRHHGPGSTKAILKALEANPPDVLVVEAPADAEGLLQYINRQPAETDVEQVPGEQLVPPISALIYNPKNINQAIYLPFTEFSPEWQALLFAVRRNIPVRFMDLPMHNIL